MDVVQQPRLKLLQQERQRQRLTQRRKRIVHRLQKQVNSHNNPINRHFPDERQRRRYDSKTGRNIFHDNHQRNHNADELRYNDNHVAARSGKAQRPDSAQETNHVFAADVKQHGINYDSNGNTISEYVDSKQYVIENNPAPVRPNADFYQDNDGQREADTQQIRNSPEYGDLRASNQKQDVMNQSPVGQDPLQDSDARTAQHHQAQDSVAIHEERPEHVSEVQPAGREANEAPRSQDPEDPAVSDIPDLTVVTALFDLGRGHWRSFRRPLELYLNYSQQLMALNVPLVAYVQPEVEARIWSMRRGKEHITDVVVSDTFGFALDFITRTFKQRQLF